MLRFVLFLTMIEISKIIYFVSCHDDDIPILRFQRYRFCAVLFRRELTNVSNLMFL